MAKTDKSEKSKYHVPALEKGLDILEQLSSASTPLSLTQLAQRLGRNTNEIFRVLTGLESRGYVRREQHSGHYRLSLKLYELAHQYPPIQNLLSVSVQPMDKLAEALRESCHLSVIRRGSLVVLRQSLSPARVRLSIDVGGRFPVVNTVSGRLLLACMSPDERARFLAVDPDYQSLSAEARVQLAARLERIQQNCYATAEHETHVGVRDYAVLIGNPDVGLVAALAVASLTPVIEPKDGDTILAHLQACAQQITTELGFTTHED
ncbi:MAG: IclR family transcriptional regulator [Chloroflexi bacterium]|nr:MAG: IclR family transcriptional regulator [Chloroflexota bacterium]